MNIDLTFPQIALIFTFWFLIGAALDFTKNAISILRNSTSSISKEVEKTSRSQREKLPLTREDKNRVVTKFIQDIADAIGKIKGSLISWSNNFIEQVVEKDSSERDPVPDHIPADEANNEEVSIFNSKPGNRYAGQKIIGALLELVILLAFLWADAAQGAQTLSVLFPTASIPQFLNNIIVPLIVASAGTAFVLGTFIGDVLHLTHLGVWGNLKGNPKKVFLFIIITILIVTITLSASIALYRADILGAVETQRFKMISVYSQSLVIIPMLITTALLLHGVFGLFVVLSIAIRLVAIPFAISEFFVDLLGTTVDFGAVSIDFVFSRIIWLVLATLELIFSLLEKLLSGSFLILVNFINIIFYIPYLIINVSLEKISGKRIKDYFLEMDEIKEEHFDKEVILTHPAGFASATPPDGLKTPMPLYEIETSIPSPIVQEEDGQGSLG